MKKTATLVLALLLCAFALGAQSAGAVAPSAPAPAATAQPTQPAATDSGSPAASTSPAAAPTGTATPAATAAPGPAAATTPAPAATPAATPPATPTAASNAVTQEGAHYLVSSDLGAARGAALLAKLEALYGIYNRVFRFDEGRLPGKLVVREFAAKADFDAYLLKIAGETRADFVYVHYTSPQRRELLVYDKPEPDYDRSLAHQAFIQFIKAYIQEPPLWLRDGFAVFFEDLRFEGSPPEPQGGENLAWLPTVKSLAAKGSLLPLDKLLSLSPEDAKADIEVFYPEAWAFVSFLINDRDSDYSRLLWETVATLDPQAGLDDNQRAFAKRLADWYGLEATQKAFEDYVAGRKTYSELLSSGADLYGKKDYEKASAAFQEAEGLDPTGYVAPYYLGLIAYDQGDWAGADSLYRLALERGCDQATASYAIGLNEIARGLSKEGAADLAKAAAASPERYKAKVDDILSRLGQP